MTTGDTTGAAAGAGGPARPPAARYREYLEYAALPLPLVFAGRSVTVELHIDGEPFDVGGARTDSVRWVRGALAGWGVEVRAVHRTAGAAPGAGRAGGVAVYAECLLPEGTLWGAGIDPDVETAALPAVRSAVTRARLAATMAAPARPSPAAEDAEPLGIPAPRPSHPAVAVRAVIATR
ncbi:hypothetical protein [Sphaerisporangium sp. NPDC051011]|uniref:hypothetical protein n=1 Tax=Sphaerisporangium sp. NPDC051011 TaxID=3155792 RepID=UPI0033D231E1